MELQRELQLPLNNSRYFLIGLASIADNARMRVVIKSEEGNLFRMHLSCLASGALGIIMAGTVGLAVGCTASALFAAFVPPDRPVLVGTIIRRHLSAEQRTELVRSVAVDILPLEYDNIDNLDAHLMTLLQNTVTANIALRSIATFFHEKLNLRVLPPWDRYGLLRFIFPSMLRY